ncbi:complex I subunit 5 family protein [Qiania dongpingensis]|uniref:Proton-conducting membrane transporter n=1 Tax=Qiania dongpingensis TaxID=2763669 RepID=A0A7G9G3V7_9FIRM|nr:proton-conducting transporter membrane subunit [Qiania dongpingensis]QNM05489.1 proton-conducting membrane transporter [Qiania dongpingensis]
MNQLLLVTPVLLPIAGGILMLMIPEKEARVHPIFTELIVLAASAMIWAVLFTGRGQGNGAVLFSMAGNLKVFFRMDGMGAVFSGLVSVLWPLATLYAFEYMEGDKRGREFFAFYTMTYGVTLGIALSGNLVTLYLFYELLTLVTFPLVLHDRTKEAIRASRKYLFYSIGGAAFAFIGLVFVLIYGSTADFTLGGVLNKGVPGFNTNVILFMYVLAFFGFGVKAALFPVHSWLPSVSVAPTPVTALLHAVAVVKSGAFAILRLTYFSYGAGFLKGTWAHYVVLGAVLVTIVYGSTMAVKEVHFKRRLAYSTISNLSYVLLGTVMMSAAGMVAALSHLVFHAFMKICSFFCAGAVMHQSGRNYVYELDGIGKKMPVTFACFTIAGLSLTGIPLFAGFISKWNIAQAAVGLGGIPGFLAAGVLLYSALMTGIYMMTVVVRAYFPKAGYDETALDGVKEPGWRMLVPIVIFAAVILFFGLYSRPLLHFLKQTAGGSGI